MSLVRARWMLIAASLGGCTFTLWLLLAPAKTAESGLPPIARIDADYIPPAALDPALSSGLFVPGEPIDTASMNSAAPSGTAAPAGPPRLVGIAAKRGTSVALAVDQAGQTRLLRSGEEIDGWKLTGIGRDHVIFTQGARKERVALDFANKAVGGGSAPTQQLVDTGGQ